MPHPKWFAAFIGILFLLGSLGADPKPGDTVKFRHLWPIRDALQKQIDALDVRVKALEAAQPAPEVGFLEGQPSPAIALQGVHDVTIEGKVFDSLGAGVNAIYLYRCARVVIKACDFARVAQCVTMLECTDVSVEDCRYLDILGPHTRTGAHTGNFVQLDKCTGAAVRRCKGKGQDTEDVVSSFQSHDVTVEDCHFQGTDWTSASGSGIMLGDGGGTNNRALRNKIHTAGQVGIGIAGGTGHVVNDNILYGAKRAGANLGISVGWNQTRATCHSHEVRGNKVKWFNAAGQENARWHPKEVDDPAGWNENNWSADIDPATMEVQL